MKVFCAIYCKNQNNLTKMSLKVSLGQLLFNPVELYSVWKQTNLTPCSADWNTKPNKDKQIKSFGPELKAHTLFLTVFAYCTLHRIMAHSAGRRKLANLNIYESRQTGIYKVKAFWVLDQVNKVRTNEIWGSKFNSTRITPSYTCCDFLGIKAGI